MSDNYHKYQKYKNKYLKLKNQRAGQYNMIVGPDKNVIDLLHFWGNQFTENAYIIYLMITDEKLKNEALILYKGWLKYTTDNFEVLGINRDKIVMDKEDFSKIDSKLFKIDDGISLMDELRDYLDKIYQLTNISGEFIGWIYPLFIKHILNELNHVYSEILNNDVTDKDKMLFWNQSNAEEAGLVAHFLDPTLGNDLNFERLNEYYHRVMNKISDPEKQKMMSMSVSYAEEIDLLITNIRSKYFGDDLRSMMSPILINNIYRKNKRCLYVLHNIATINANLL